MFHDDPHTSFATLSALTEELKETIRLACDLTASGQAIDLADLDRRIGLLCAKALELPPDEGHRVVPQLIALSGSVDALSRAMVARAPPSG